ncbi:MAG: carboxypeptidase-like regulatory domain-containing protein, partial [Acidobacteriota bacterium]
MFKTFRFGTICAMLAMLAVSGFAQLVATVISGFVIGKDGAPAVGAEIKFTRTDIKAEFKIKSDKNGKYAYPTLPQGKYDVSIFIAGTEVSKSAGIFTDPKKIFELNLDLSKPAGAQISGSGVAAAPQVAASNAPTA